MEANPPAGLTGAHHPDTSYEAGDSRQTFRSQRDEILLAFLDAGEDGLTAAEAGQAVGINTNIAGARFLELRGARRDTPSLPLIQRTPERRALRDGGRAGIVHQMTGEGERRAMLLQRLKGASSGGR